MDAVCSNVKPDSFMFPLKSRVKTVIILLILIAFIPALSIFSVATRRKNIRDEIFTSVPTTGQKIEFIYDGNPIEPPTIKDLLTRIVAAEMPANFEIEALKAQAIAAYTYVCYTLDQESREATNPDEPIKYILKYQNHVECTDENKMRERWGEKFEPNFRRIQRAVKSVLGLTIKDTQEKPIYAMFSSMSCGMTNNISDYFSKNQEELPYLISVPCPGDKLEPKYLNVREFQVSEFEEKINEYNQKDKIFTVNITKKPETWIEILAKSPSDYVTKVKILGTELSGKQVREIFGLRSSSFDIEFKENKFIFTTRGFGHGVGMSQYGANWYAKQGYNYKEILEHFYPGTHIS
ncbi:MAG: stage II sporulation protein D [Candidatus Improbicoccus devescovinae]|nr:MAG: stage II sporulation protein D [Candidatus Improbicoccus devescovinae]